MCPHLRHVPSSLNAENNHLCPLGPYVSQVAVILLLGWLARRSLEEFQAGELKAHWGSGGGLPTGGDFQESAAPSSSVTSLSPVNTQTHTRRARCSRQLRPPEAPSPRRQQHRHLEPSQTPRTHHRHPDPYTPPQRCTRSTHLRAPWRVEARADLRL